jgi:hypothetical protein
VPIPAASVPAAAMQPTAPGTADARSAAACNPAAVVRSPAASPRRRAQGRRSSNRRTRMLLVSTQRPAQGANLDRAVSASPAEVTAQAHHEEKPRCTAGCSPPSPDLAAAGQNHCAVLGRNTRSELTNEPAGLPAAGSRPDLALAACPRPSPGVNVRGIHEADQGGGNPRLEELEPRRLPPLGWLKWLKRPCWGDGRPEAYGRQARRATGCT